MSKRKLLLFAFLLMFFPLMSCTGRWIGSDAKEAYSEKEFNINIELADQGDSEACFKVGEMYQFGSGVAQNYEKAIHWYEKSAEQEYAPAQVSLGLMYENGLGVQPNDTKAAFWYQKAADNGYAEGQCYLGDMYRDGAGVDKNFNKALEWYQSQLSKSMRRPK